MRRPLSVAVVALLAMSLASIALADDAIGDKGFVQGHIDSISVDGTTSGDSYISQQVLPVAPDYLEVNIDGFQNGYYLRSKRMYLTVFPSGVWRVPSGTLPIASSGFIEAVGFHYGTWDAGSEGDSCSTYESRQFGSGLLQICNDDVN